MLCTKCVSTSSGRVSSIIWMHHMDADKAYREKARRESRKDASSDIEQILEATSQNSSCTTIKLPSLKLDK